MSEAGMLGDGAGVGNCERHSNRIKSRSWEGMSGRVLQEFHGSQKRCSPPGQVVSGW